MRDVKTRAAMERPKTRQKNAVPRTAVRILQRHYAQQKQERQSQHQRQQERYDTFHGQKPPSFWDLPAYVTLAAWKKFPVSAKKQPFFANGCFF
mgnify:CR=1 FL=1